MALEERGRRITLKADISQLKTAFNKINALARESATELRKINNALRYNPNNVNLLVQKQKELNRVVAQNYKLIGNLKKQIEEHTELGETRAAQKLTTQLEILRAVNESFKESLKETNNTLKNFGNIQALQRLDNEIKESRDNVERLNKALKLDTTDINLAANKFRELQSQASILDEKVLLLVKDLKQIDFKINPQGYNQLKSKLEEAKSEAKQVRNELDRLGGSNFNPTIVQLEKLDNELKKSRDTSKSLKRELEFSPRNSILKALRLEEARNELEKTREKIKLMKSELNKLNTTQSREEFTRLNVKIAESERHVKELLNSVGVLNATKLGGVRSGFESVGNSIKNNIDRIGDFGRNMTFGYTLPVAYGTKRVVESFAETDTAIRKVAAASDEGAKDFGNAFSYIEQKAREKSSGSVYSIREVSNGMEALVKAGLNAEQAAGAVGSAMNLAAADGIELDRATEIITDGMNSMGIEFDKDGKNVQKFTDILNTAAVKSTTDVAQMGEAMKYVGPIAGTLGFKMEDLGAALAIMANQGVKASTAGTSLRSGLTNLVKPSAQAKAALDEVGFSLTDQQGKTKDLSVIIAELREKTKGMTREQKLSFAATVFGKTAMSGWAAILNETDENVKEFTDSIYNSTGATQKMADNMNSGAGGALRKFQAQLSNTAYEIGKAWGPTIEKILGYLTDLLKALAESSDSTKMWITGIAGATAALAPLTWGIARIISPIKTVIDLFRNFGGAAKTLEAGVGAAAGKTSLLRTAISGLTSPMGLAITAGGLLGLGIATLKEKYDPLIIAQREAKQSAENLGETFKKVGETSKEFSDKIQNSKGVLDEVFGNTENVKQKLNDLANTTQEKFGIITSIIDKAVSEHRSLNQQEVQSFNTTVDEIKNLQDERIQNEGQRYDTVINLAKNFASNKNISDQEYQNQLASHIKQISDIHTQSVNDTEAWYTKISTVNALLPPEQQLNAQQLEAIHQQMLTSDQQHYSESMQAAITAYQQRTGLDQNYINDLRTAKSGMEEVERQHKERSQQIWEENSNNLHRYNALMQEEDKRYAEEKKWHLDDLAGKFDENRVKQLGTWLQLIQDTINNGGTLTEMQASNVQSFLATMDTMPQETKDKIIQGLKDAGIDVDSLGQKLAEQMKSNGSNMMAELAGGIDSQHTNVITSSDNILKDIHNSILNTSLHGPGQTMINTARDGINSGKPNVDSSIADIAKGIQDKITKTDMAPKGREKSEELAKGIKSADGSVWNAASETANHGKNAAGSIDFTGTGQNMTYGLANGASSVSWALENAMSSIVARGLAAAKAAAGVSSPARVFKREVGYWIPPGIAEGIRSNSKIVNTSITDTMKDSLETAKNFKLGEKMSSMVDFSTNIGTNYAFQHKISENNIVVDTLNTLIDKVNTLELKSDVYLDGDKVGDATYKRHQVINRRYGTI